MCIRDRPPPMGLIPIHVSLPGPPGPEGDVGDSPIRVVLEPDGKAAFHPPDMGARRVEGVAGTVLSSKSASDDDVLARVEELIRLHANHPGTAPVLHEGRPDVVHHTPLCREASSAATPQPT